MNIVNNYCMEYLKSTSKISGIYYLTKRVLKFKQREEFISEDDVMSLFFGAVKILKETTERVIEKKYINRILSLEKEVKTLQKLNNLNL